MSDYSRKLDIIEKRVYKELKKRGCKEVCVIYSAYETDEEGLPVDNLNEIAVKGKCKFVGFADDFWGGKEAQDYTSPVLTDPTWLDLCYYANEMILTTNDHHHVFLEGVYKIKTKENINTYEFSMGS